MENHLGNLLHGNYCTRQIIFLPLFHHYWKNKFFGKISGYRRVMNHDVQKARIPGNHNYGSGAGFTGAFMQWIKGSKNGSILFIFCNGVGLYRNFIMQRWKHGTKIKGWMGLFIQPIFVEGIILLCKIYGWVLKLHFCLLFFLFSYFSVNLRNYTSIYYIPLTPFGWFERCRLEEPIPTLLRPLLATHEAAFSFFQPTSLKSSKRC